MAGLDKKRWDAARRVGSRPLQAASRLVRRFAGDRRGNVLIMFGLMLPVLLALVTAGVDFSYAEDAKVTLQDASDAAALAVSAEVVKNPNDTLTTLQTLAQNTLTADDPGATNLSITNFHVCAPAQLAASPTACTNNGVTMTNDTVVVAVQATAPCIPIPIPTTICQGSPPGQTVSGGTTTVIGFGANLQLNIVLDSSGSMIVGATAGDVQGIANWMGATTPVYTQQCTGTGSHRTCSQVQTGVTYPNWNAVRLDDQGPAFNNNGAGNGDNPPCAFACHVESNGDVSSADMAQGLVNAHQATNSVTSAQVQTRFDVMISAANQLITSIQSTLNNNANLAKNNYYFNIYSFDDSIHQYGTSNMPCTGTSCSGVTTAIAAVAPGQNTHLNTAMQTFAASSGTDSIGANGNGSSTSSPLKFMILVTDGLQSDRNLNWQDCTSWGYYAPWLYSNACLAGQYDAPINTAYCTTLKNEGVVLAVLETPYVPLTGQDPNNAPYEGDVRDTIYPTGPTSASTVSAALQSCASTGYYFQAVNSTDIATGFLTLTNQFIAAHSYISQ
jgi:Flp pilus assembly protein TadG